MLHYLIFQKIQKNFQEIKKNFQEIENFNQRKVGFEEISSRNLTNLRRILEKLPENFEESKIIKKLVRILGHARLLQRASIHYLRITTKQIFQ